MKYNEVVCNICGDNWESGPYEEREGGYGVACMLAYLNGAKPTIEDISDHLGVKEKVIRVPFYRLLESGLFSKSFNARNDPTLIGDGRTETSKHLEKDDYTFTVSDSIQAAWCQIAAVAGGLVHCSFK